MFLFVFETLKANSGKIEEQHSSPFRDQLKIGSKYIINYDYIFSDHGCEKIYGHTNSSPLFRATGMEGGERI